MLTMIISHFPNSAGPTKPFLSQFSFYKGAEVSQLSGTEWLPRLLEPGEKFRHFTWTFVCLRMGPWLSWSGIQESLWHNTSEEKSKLKLEMKRDSILKFLKVPKLMTVCEWTSFKSSLSRDLNSSIKPDFYSRMKLYNSSSIKTRLIFQYKARHTIMTPLAARTILIFQYKTGLQYNTRSAATPVQN